MVNRVCSKDMFVNQLKNFNLGASSAPTSAYALAKLHASAFYNDAGFEDSKRFQRFTNATEIQVSDFIRRVRRIPSDDAILDPTLENELHLIFFAEIRDMVSNDTKDEEWLAQELGVPALPSSHLDEAVEIKMVKCIRNAATFRTFDFCAALYCPVDTQNKRSYRKYLRNYLNILFDVETCREAYEWALARACHEYIIVRSIQDGFDKSNWLSSLKVLSDKDCLNLLMQIYKAYAEYLGDHILISMWGQQSTKRLRAENLRMAKSTGALEDKIEQLTKDVESRNAQLVKFRKENDALRTNVQDYNEKLDEIDDLKRELKKKLTECEELKDECTRLKEQVNDLWRNLLAEPDDDVEPANTLNLDEIMQDPLSKTARVVFIRDIERKNYVMMQRLAEVFPRAKFTDGMSSDINVRTTDLIVALTAYTSHSVYYKGADLAKRQNVPFMPIKNANVEIIASEMLRKLKQISPKVSCE